MGVPSKKIQDKLPNLKRNINDAYVYFQKNREYFNRMRNYVLNTTLSDQQRKALEDLDRTVIEFNVLEAYISRLMGEFSKQVPGVNVYADPTETVPPEATIDFVQNHMRHIITNLRSNEIYKDQLTGGFSCMKVWTEYEHYKNFKQKICIDRAFDPLLVFFDPAAQKSHKGDGSYCGEIIPLTEDQFKYAYPNVNIEGCMKGNLEGFKWGYKSNRKMIIMLCDYYEKRSKKESLYELANGMALTKDEYAEFLMIYDKNHNTDQPPIIVNKRTTDIPYIVRYRLISDQILEYDVTEYSGLPLIFVDGNSAQLRRNGDGSIIEQITRSYVHNAVGFQNLKNLTGQTIANNAEMMITNRMKIAIDSVRPEDMDFYTDMQKNGHFPYRQYSDDGERQYNPPQEVVNVPLPPEIQGTFVSVDQSIQASLGSYDASLGINKNQLSGVAIVEGATQSNAAAMPFVMSYLAALQQAAEIIVDLIPKCYKGTRSMPVVTNEDKSEFVTINNKKDKDSPQMNFNPADLKIEVKAGVNFEVQKNRALQMLIELSQALPGMAQLINNPKGLAIVADNLSFKGADQIKQMAEDASKQMEEQKNKPQPPSPVQQKLANEQFIAQSKDQNEKASLSIKQQEATTKRLTAVAGISQAQVQAALQADRNSTERAVHHVGLQIKNKKIEHDFASDMIGNASSLMSNAMPNQGQVPPQSQIVPQNGGQ